MLGLSRIFAALTISCSVANSLSRPLAMVPPGLVKQVSVLARPQGRVKRDRFTSTRGPFRNAAIGARLSPTNNRRKHGKPVGGGAQERDSGNPCPTYQRLHRR